MSREEGEQKGGDPGMGEGAGVIWLLCVERKLGPACLPGPWPCRPVRGQKRQSPCTDEETEAPSAPPGPPDPRIQLPPYHPGCPGSPGPSSVPPARPRPHVVGASTGLAAMPWEHVPLPSTPMVTALGQATVPVHWLQLLPCPLSLSTGWPRQQCPTGLGPCVSASASRPYLPLALRLVV